MVSEERKKELKEISILEKVLKDTGKEYKESKELFSKEDIEVRTDISEEETSIIARLKYLCETFDLTKLDKAITNLMQLRLSKGRKSRKEFIEALDKNPQFLPNNMGNMGAFNNGR